MALATLDLRLCLRLSSRCLCKLCPIHIMEHLLNILLDLGLHLFTLEHEAELLKGTPMSFREQEVHCCDLHQNPNAVDNVVSPTNIVQCNGVNVGVEEHSKSDGELLECNSLGALLIGEDLNHVGVGESIPTEVVKAANDQQGREKVEPL